MKVVLDTNVLISGIFFSGPPGRILAAWADGRFELVASVEVLAEYRRVAERLQKKFPSIDINAILDPITRETRIVEDDGLVAGRLTGRTRLYWLNPRYFARKELNDYLRRLAVPETELTARIEGLRKRASSSRKRPRRP